VAGGLGVGLGVHDQLCAQRGAGDVLGTRDRLAQLREGDALRRLVRGRGRLRVTRLRLGLGLGIGLGI